MDAADESDSEPAFAARRAANNMGEYINATERHGRLALKAQSNCRATLEALAKLHQPREQTVRHVHVNEGGQAVVADQFHLQIGGPENADRAEQPHATGCIKSPTGPINTRDAFHSTVAGKDPAANG